MYMSEQMPNTHYVIYVGRINDDTIKNTVYNFLLSQRARKSITCKSQCISHTRCHQNWWYTHEQCQIGGVWHWVYHRKSVLGRTFNSQLL